MKKEITLSTEKIYSGKIINVTLSKVLCPNGVESKREMVSHPGGVCIYAEVDGKVALVRQYRFPYDDFVFELPAGKIEKGEDHYLTGLRELEEEVGLKAKSLIDYGKMYPSVGYTNEIIYLYKAKDVIKTHTSFDDDENLDIYYFSVDELLEMIKNGKIVDAKTIILILKVNKL